MHSKYNTILDSSLQVHANEKKKCHKEKCKDSDLKGDNLSTQRVHVGGGVRGGEGRVRN